MRECEVMTINYGKVTVHKVLVDDTGNERHDALSAYQQVHPTPNARVDYAVDGAWEVVSAYYNAVLGAVILGKLV